MLSGTILILAREEQSGVERAMDPKGMRERLRGEDSEQRARGIFT